EDGIRDFHVTGVQTCALPISVTASRLTFGKVVTSPGILHPSILIAPVPHRSTLSATVPSSGLRARIIGSWAGFSAVPQPSHFLASGVAGAVMSITVVFVDQSSVVSFDIMEPLWCEKSFVLFSPIFSRLASVR